MQMNEKVLTALEVLRNFAENDFELHRIDVLIKDLTNPPKVEVIDDNYSRFNDVIYKKNKDGHYTHTDGIQVAVYRYYFGKIPEGYSIHHKNEIKSDNDISNLQLLTNSEHRRLHNLINKHEGICRMCGMKFTTTSLRKDVEFCSGRCRESWLYKNNLETRICKFCGKTFLARKKSSTACCCRSHSALWRETKRNKPQKICPVCGNTFLPKNRLQTYCSYSCANKTKNHKKTLS